MGNKRESLEAEALQLTAGERATFAQLLLASLDEDAEIEDAWAAETERRIAVVASGTVQAIPIVDALAQVRESRAEFNGEYIELPPPLSARSQRPRFEAFRP